MPRRRILEKMLDRLYASLARGPSLNCRPHASRQRIDLTALAALDDVAPLHVLRELLDGGCTMRARVPMPETLVREAARGWGADAEPAPEKTEEQRGAEGAWRAQKSLLAKLRNLSEDARTYEQDTGVHALSLGFPLLSLPPGSTGGGTRRILAPVAFVPVSLEVATAGKPGLRLACRGEGVDLVTPNPALMAWFERETGQPFEELFEDEEGAAPWREIGELVRVVAERLELPYAFAEPQALQAVPRADDLGTQPALLESAVLGLFPASNQGLLRDTRDMLEDDALEGPVVSFLDVDVALDRPPADVPEPGEGIERGPRRFGTERMVARADPFQSRAVARARTSTGLVVHGPPGTGKSQTITNIIGDHLARGERVLFVCDKRTALDVVNNRLSHIGLGRLAAIVHDPRRDQRDLYMSVRGNLEELAELQTDENAEAAVEKIDRELQQIHDELTAAHAALMQGDTSFHDRVGEWLSYDGPPLDLEQPVTAAMLDEHERDVRVLLDRANDIDYAHNPWRSAAGCPLGDYLARPVDETRRALASVAEHARVADRARDAGIPPFDATEPLDAQVARRAELRERLAAARETPAAVRERVVAEEVSVLRAALDDAAKDRAALDTPLDRDLSLGGPPAHLNRDIAVLDRYLRAMEQWWSFLAFSAKHDAGRVLREHGLNRTPGAARRLHDHFVGMRARLLLTEAVGRLRGVPVEGALADDELQRELDGFTDVLAALAVTDETLRATARSALVDEDVARQLDEGLAHSPARAEALGELEASCASIGLFADTWRKQFAMYARGGRESTPTITQLQGRFDTLEGVLRVRDGLAGLPGALREALGVMFAADAGYDRLRRSMLSYEIRERLQADAALHGLDEQRVEQNLKRIHELEAEKRERVREAILHRWVERQRERLLAGTRTRLNGEGANLRRRLLVRGKRALRLRQVVAAGETREDGEIDPLFDMCPVWMASPETVAQVFSRRPVFDAVVFDEASQCRLEEALPVLTRAHRAVIAGDPKQLPPTRFFESAIASSDDDAMETDQDLFEAQQGEVEDLLCAALNLQVEEAYLDVHYRSRNADLIEFSNENFYRNRLQALPGHPSRVASTPPLKFERVDGLYDERRNRPEAERVCAIIDELLRGEEPPSIGVACFNLRQRELILDLLDEKAGADEAFAARLATARERVGEGSFEGLFVKNLESVQGDERDHIIISTTYGPNRDGKFYRRFGPLGRAGGGRRLNVLVTRARHEVHLVTSIPREAYASVESVPDGMQPNGSWLLFAYLRYAEALQRSYAAANVEREHFVDRPIPPASDFARGLGRQLAHEHGLACDAHWGNPGFCVDVALHEGCGLLCDFARYPHAPDPVEWEVFRTGILEALGWELRRVWTPDYFRDPDRTVNRVRASARPAT